MRSASLHCTSIASLTDMPATRFFPPTTTPSIQTYTATAFPAINQAASLPYLHASYIRRSRPYQAPSSAHGGHGGLSSQARGPRHDGLPESGHCDTLHTIYLYLLNTLLCLLCRTLERSRLPVCKQPLIPLPHAIVLISLVISVLYTSSP